MARIEGEAPALSTTSNRNKTKTISSKQDKAPELLPLTGDLHKLRLFLLTEINDLCEARDKREEKWNWNY